MKIKRIVAAGALALALAAAAGASVLSLGSSDTAQAAPPEVVLDFDITNGTGPCNIVDVVANIPVAGSVQVAVCQNGLAESPAAVDYVIFYDDTIVVAPEVADVAPALDDNPDANVGATTFGATNLGTGWDCTGGGLNFPVGDSVIATGPGNGRAFSGGCSSTAGPYTLGPSGVLGVVTFNGLALGSSTLVFGAVTVTGASGDEAGTCNPSIVVPITCTGGTINVIPAPTNTPAPPTNTPQPATNTPVPPTATATPAGPTINKSPTSVNLFLCEGPTCTLDGEGSVTLNEIVNVPGPTGYCAPGPIPTPVPPGLGCILDQDNDGREDGVGAYEFQVKFDHKVFNVEINNGPWLTGTNTRIPNCTHSVVTENWILFGCTTTGPVGDPTAPGAAAGVQPNSGILATVKLTPNEDLKFRLHPGNENGIVRMILDENCELTTIFGEPVPGSVNGGLTLQCGDAAVTVRILEGDLNLDCEVDVLDQQLIAFRYGAFFGNINYDPWYDMEPALKDFDVDIKDLQKVFGRDQSDCQNPIPPQPPLTGYSVGPL